MRKLNYVTKKLPGDTYTPIGIYASLEGRHKMLFESNAKHEESGRYSFITVNPVGELFGNDQISTFNGETKNMAVIERLKEVLPIIEGNYPFPFFGGAIGYFSYETAFYFMDMEEVVNDAFQLPDVHLFFYDTFIVIDHMEQTVTLVAVDLFHSRTEIEMHNALHLLESQLTKHLPQLDEQEVALKFSPIIPKEQFINRVLQAKEHIARGDVLQVVVSQRFEADYKEDPFILYRKLRTTNPSPYMFYMDFGPTIVLGTSPESVVRVRDRQVTMNPIAGTKPRGHSAVADKNIEKALLQDPKELAEHHMLVDLGLEDLRLVCDKESVKVGRSMYIEKYKYVMHIVSEITGMLNEDLHVMDVLAATLPAGTVSGAPKERAMQIIHELEQQKRGIYAGGIGYVSISGNMDLTLAIRTMVVKNQKAYVQAGAGIVAQSDAQMEYEETVNKARALLEIRGLQRTKIEEEV